MIHKLNFMAIAILFPCYLQAQVQKGGKFWGMNLNISGNSTQHESKDIFVPKDSVRSFSEYENTLHSAGFTVQRGNFRGNNLSAGWLLSAILSKNTYKSVQTPNQSYDQSNHSTNFQIKGGYFMRWYHWFTPRCGGFLETNYLLGFDRSRLEGTRSDIVLNNGVSITGLGTIGMSYFLTNKWAIEGSANLLNASISHSWQNNPSTTSTKLYASAIASFSGFKVGVIRFINPTTTQKP